MSGQRVTFKRNVSMSFKKLEIVTKSELAIKTCSVNAADVQRKLHADLNKAYN